MGAHPFDFRTTDENFTAVIYPIQFKVQSETGARKMLTHGQQPESE